MNKVKTYISNYYNSFSREQILSPVPLFVLAVILYCQQSWVEGFFPDGYLYSAFGKHAAEKGKWLIPHLSVATYDKFPDHIPFIFMLEGLFFKVFDFSYSSARIFASLFGLSTLVLLYKIVKDFKSEKMAYLASLVFILTPPLMKKIRFPNLDVPMMFFIFSSLYFYLRTLNKGPKNWIGCGLAFGLAMLTKGPFAIFIPLSIFIHLIASKRIVILKSVFPWAGLFLGFAVFGLWPLLLHLNNEFWVFERYIYSNFVHSISKGRGVSDYSFFTYFAFLFKQLLPWAVLSVISIFLYVKRKKKDEFLLFVICFVVGNLLFISVPKFKYSHYLMPFYPFIAILAAYSFSLIKENSFNKLAVTFRWLVPLVAVLLLVFPLTTKSRRDQEIVKTIKVVKNLKEAPTAWGIVNGAYPFFNIANIMGLGFNAPVFDMSDKAIEAKIHGILMNPHMKMDKQMDLTARKWGFIMKIEDVRKLENKFPDVFKKIFRKLVYYKKRNVAFIVERSLTEEHGFLEYKVH